MQPCSRPLSTACRHVSVMLWLCSVNSLLMHICETAPQGYLAQPPPGPYPPNGNGPRGSMPPTPMQQHAYAFHQSPQRTPPAVLRARTTTDFCAAVPHSVPYPMMMQQPPPPPPQGGGHPYDGQGGVQPVPAGPPGPMNGQH